MRSINKFTLERLRTITADMEDCREVFETEIRSLVYFNRYVLGEDSQIGRRIYAYQIRQRSRDYMLLVKSVREGVPQVAFYSGRTPICCVTGFVKSWLNETVKWQPDKFPSFDKVHKKA